MKSNFQNLRKSVGTQNEVAILLNISQQAIAKWEKGRAYPRRKTLKAVSKLFNCSESEILEAIDNSR